MNAEDLPSSVAWPCARAGSLESAHASGTPVALQALVELLTIRMLAETLRRPEAVPFTVESAMRLSMLEPMDAEAWIDLYAALDHSGMVELLDLPAEVPQALRTAATALGVESSVPFGECLLDWLERTHAAAEPPPSTVDAIAATCRSARGLAASPPWFVREVREAAGGFGIDARRLVGTSWPPVLRIASATAPVVEAGTLVFWDGQGPPLPVPPWLMRWDEAAGQLWTYAGREPKHGRWRYVSRHPALRTPAGADHEQGEVPQGMPPFLAEPTWATPLPGEPRLDPNAQTAALLRHPDPHRVTTAMAADRASVPQAATAPESPPADARLVLRVVVGPDLLHYAPLEPAAPIVLGRNQGSATFPLHHHQVSRAHTQVRITTAGEVFVKDLGSTNGTQLQGRTLGSGEESRIQPGEVIGIGPVLLRVEWLAPEREERLVTIAGLRADDVRRDPSTLMLRPTHLIDELPDPIKPSFREGGTAAGAPPLWGVLLYLDRLAAIHAQHGEKLADRVFRDVGRVLQYEADRPESWVRVGYGEVLLPLVGATPEAARAEAERLVGVVGDHPWEHPIERLSVTASIGEKSASEPAADWLRRLRRQLQDGRTRQGRGRVYPSP